MANVTEQSSINTIMEPIIKNVDCAADKIRSGNFDERVNDEFGQTAADYLHSCGHFSRDIELRFLQYVSKTVTSLHGEKSEYAFSAVLLMYKAMSVTEISAEFVLENDKMVAKIEVSSRFAIQMLLSTIFADNQWTYMGNKIELIQTLEAMARGSEKIKPAFCYILSSDVYQVCQRFNSREVNNPTFLGKLCLLQATSASNGKAFDLAIKYCKYAAETLYNYENSESFMIWAQILELKGNISAAKEKAELALKMSKNVDEKHKIKQFLETIFHKMEENVCTKSQVDQSRLSGTNAYTIKEKQAQAKAVQDCHTSKKKRSRRRGKRKRTNSSCSGKENDLNHKASFKRTRQTSNSSNASGFSSNVAQSPLNLKEQPNTDQDPCRLCNSKVSDFFSSDDETSTCSEKEDLSNEEDQELDYEMDNMESQTENETCDQTWFEQSEDVLLKKSNDNKSDYFYGSEIQLDEKHVANLWNSCYKKHKQFYKDFRSKDNLYHLLQKESQKYKKCKIRIESAQSAFCKILDSAGAQNEIEIAGRSKCGQCFNNDEVVVEILFDPKEKADNEKTSKTVSMAYGKVVGVLNSQFLKKNQHPVLACTSNETEGWLLRPLCQSIPKIHVMNKMIKTNPNRAKYMVDIYEVVGSKLKFKREFRINPVLRDQYVFIVVYVGWSNKYVYPLGAVLDVLQCGKDFNSSLRILEMQYKVPSLFPEDVITQMQRTENTVDVNGREDRTKDLVFTIDPPHSKDLDDALSVVRNGNNYIVGVHIADVASVVKKDDAIDKEARRRAVSFYIQDRRTRNMLPEPLSQDICSLVPGEIRPAVSTFFLLDQEGKIIKEPTVKKTIIKSFRQFSYEEVQKIIENGESSPEHQQLREAILILHDLAQNIWKRRLKDARFTVPFSDPSFLDVEDHSDCPEAHALVEEFMIYTNTTVAKILTKRFPKCLPLRCQTPPATEEVQNWMKHENKIVDLLVHLQGKKLGDNKISAPESITKYAKEKVDFIPVQSDIWELILEYLKARRFNNSFKLALKMICTDEIHPLQNLAWIHWIRLLDKAEYRCSGVTQNKEEVGHFSLEIQPYIHFTSPIRRYVDLVTHRIVHALLSDMDSPYTTDDITELCEEVNEATSRQKEFGRSCTMLKKAETICKAPAIFYGIVDEVSETGLGLSLPGLPSVPPKCKEIKFCLLDLNKKPEIKNNTVNDTDKDIIICKWKKRIYNTKQIQKTNDASELSIVNPNQHTVFIRYNDWANLLKKIFQKEWTLIPIIANTLSSSGEHIFHFREVDEVTSEAGQGIIKNQQCMFSLSFKQGQIVKIQLGTSPKNGFLLPQVELVHITKNLSFCLKHMDDPIGILSKYATSSISKTFSSVEEYKEAWLPLLEMEAALSAVSNETKPIINNVNLTLKKISVSGTSSYIGTFQLPIKFCDERNIEFEGMPVECLEKIKKEETLQTLHIKGYGCNDYLCIRCFVPGSSSSGCKDVKNGMTWIAHGRVIRARRKLCGKRQRTMSENNTDHVIVTFVLNDNCTKPPVKLKNKITATVEIISKLEMDRRTQLTIENFGSDPEKTQLAIAIALKREIPNISKCRLDIVKKIENDVVGNTDVPLPKNNKKQQEAIEKALTKSFSLIQGPPGTGKTYSGIKLIYLFNEINKKVRAEGGEKTQILFCGPSNKSVDMVAWLLLDRLGNQCPKLIRMYGNNIVNQDYPVPNRDLFSKRNIHDLNSDSRLQDITLHHIIRKRGNFAEEIREFDNIFKLMLKKEKTKEEMQMIRNFVFFHQPKNKSSEETLTDFDTARHNTIKYYTRLVNEAYTDELKRCEVILCTCSVGGNEKLVGATKIFQCIIDEAAMCPEPLALVPIIATKAKQVVLIGDHKQLRPIIQCSEAAELGMDQSLFERYSSQKSIFTFLDTQYRMHPQICKFPSEQFYEGKLKTIFNKDDTLEKLLPNEPVRHVFCHVEGVEKTLSVNTEEGNEQSKSNMAEVDKVVEIYRSLIEKRTTRRITTRMPSKDIAVLTQYNSQVHAIKSKLKAYMDPRNNNNPEAPRLRQLHVSSVVSSQGGEWDYVIFSTVRSLPTYKIEPAPTLGWCRQNLGFITDANQINVALTRARKGLIIVGNMNLLKVNTIWKNLLNHYEKKHCLIKNPDQFPAKSWN